jgi:peptidoglycan/LPS O-acetylase OafA/YrhL
VVVCVLGDLFVVDAGGTLRGAAYSFFYAANWAAALDQGFGTLSHTWSLSIEEQFYLVWPALLVCAAALSRRTRFRVAALVAAACGVIWAMTAAAVFGAGVGFSMLNNATPFRATELLSGCVLAALATRGLPPALRWVRPLGPIIGLVCLAGLIILVIVGNSTSTQWVFLSWVAVSICTVGLIATVQDPRTPAARALAVAPLVQVGKMSYGLYLWHFPVLVSIDALVGLGSAGAKWAGLILTALIVPVSYYGIERPFLRLKAKVSPGGVSKRPELNLDTIYPDSMPSLNRD